MNRRTMLKSIAGAALACVTPWKRAKAQISKNLPAAPNTITRIAQAREMDSMEALHREYYTGLYWKRGAVAVWGSYERSA